MTDRPATEPRPADKLRWALTITAREQDTGDLWMHRDDADEAVKWLDAALAEAAQGAAPRAEGLDEDTMAAALQELAGSHHPEYGNPLSDLEDHDLNAAHAARLLIEAYRRLSRPSDEKEES